MCRLCTHKSWALQCECCTHETQPKPLCCLCIECKQKFRTVCSFACVFYTDFFLYKHCRAELLAAQQGLVQGSVQYWMKWSLVSSGSLGINHSEKQNEQKGLVFPLPSISYIWLSRVSFPMLCSTKEWNIFLYTLTPWNHGRWWHASFTASTVPLGTHSSGLVGLWQNTSPRGWWAQGGEHKGRKPTPIIC